MHFLFVVAIVTLQLSAQTARASENRILEAVTSGKVKTETKVALPKVALPSGNAAPVMNPRGTQTNFERDLNLAEERDINDRAFPVMTAKWPFNAVAVCWEAPNPALDKERQWVRAAISSTWEASSGLRFKGWETCTSTNLGIRIVVNNDGPHVRFLGKYLNGVKSGMVLNFTFDTWSETCKDTEASRKKCIESIAVHEFGHAIGFAHEQNRPDKPGECREPPQGSSAGATTSITPYDKDSVMNYCNSKYNNDGKLSAFDKKAVQYIYGAPQ